MNTVTFNIDTIAIKMKRKQPFISYGKKIGLYRR